jgi:hypothetical protein
VPSGSEAITLIRIFAGEINELPLPGETILTDGGRFTGGVPVFIENNIGEEVVLALKLSIATAVIE